MTMLTTKAQANKAAPAIQLLQHDAAPPAVSPTHKRNPYYLVGEHERSSARPAPADAGRTLVCVN